MHFSVPDTQELVDESGSTYLGYNIHINGIFHCTIRYKQLHSLHEQLVKELDNNVPLPAFPPKKFFPLTVNQQEERRLMLDKYIQAIGQNTNINNSELLNGFLLHAQLETAGSVTGNDKINLYLLNGSKIDISVKGTENSGQLLHDILKHLKLDEKFYPYFSLFITYQEDQNFTLLRKLQNFESPVITQRRMRQSGTKIVLGKWYWDLKFDNDLINDPVASELLCVQAASEIDRGWISTNKEIRQRLKSIREQGKKREYLEFARSLKYYGCVVFVPCICDYPEANSKVTVAIGRNELNMKTKSPAGLEQEFIFKVTRMRCWRITTLHEGLSEKNEDSLELSFEYLMSKDNLQWITIASEQAILMSVCLQSMIDELLFKNVGGVKNTEITNKPWTYITRNGYSQTITGCTFSDSIYKNSQDTNITNQSKAEPIIKKFTEKLFIGKSKKAIQTKTSVTHENKLTSDGEFLENNAFCMIGDDDL